MFIFFTFYLPLIYLRCSTLREVFFRACNPIVLLVIHSNEAPGAKVFLCNGLICDKPVFMTFYIKIALVYAANIYIAKLPKYANTSAARNNVVAVRIGNRNTDKE